MIRISAAHGEVKSLEAAGTSDGLEEVSEDLLVDALAEYDGEY